MTLAKLIPLAIQLSMALVIFCVALHARFSDIVFLLRKPGLLVRSMISMLLVMPVFAVALAVTFDLNHSVEIALIASALSPVPPILPGKQIKAGGKASYVIGLLMISALVSIVYVPLAAALLGSVFHRPVQVDRTNLITIIATSMLLPVLAGMLVRKLAPTLAVRIDKPLSAGATVALLIAFVPILVKEWPAITALLGNFSLLAMVVFAAVGLVVGHLLGGPDANDRSVLAMATAARHPAVALAIVHNAVDQPGVMAAVLLTLLVASVVTTPYMKWREGILADSKTPDPHAT
jgi:bile acid:Na+ symporter, BASS family